MPRIIIDQERLAVARVLESLNWSHSRIGRLFGADHTTITHALRNRKTHLPSRVEEISADILARTLHRVERATRDAAVKELRAIAEELEHGI